MGKPREPDPSLTPPAGVVLISLTVNLVCWFLTGIVGYKSDAVPVKDDSTLWWMYMWIMQLVSGVLLVITIIARGRSSLMAALCAAIIGLGAAILYGMCWADWGNMATRMFWWFMGIYVAVGLEVKFEAFAVLEQRIGVLLRA